MDSPNDRLYGHYTESIYAAANNLTDTGYKRVALDLLVTYGNFIPTDRAISILDVGCGPGFWLYALQSAGYSNVEGIDISPQQVEQASQHGLKAQCADALDFLKGKASAYDVIISKDVIEHLSKDNLFSCVRLVNQALKPGGVFICTVPNADSPFAAHSRYRDLSHELLFTVESLRQLLLISDLKPVHVGGEAVPARSATAWIRRLSGRIFRSFWRSFMITEFGREAYGVPFDINLVAVASKR